MATEGGRRLPYSDHKPGTPEHDAFVRDYVRGAGEDHYATDRARVGAPSQGRGLTHGSESFGSFGFSGFVSGVTVFAVSIREALDAFGHVLKSESVTALAKAYGVPASLIPETGAVDHRKASKRRRDEFLRAKERQSWKARR